MATHTRIDFDQKNYGIPSKNIPSYSYYYTVDKNTAKYREWIADIKQFINDIAVGNPVYVEYKSSNSAGRAGTIARVKGFSERNIAADVIHDITLYIERPYRLELLQLEIEFDDRKNKLKPQLDDIVWLKGYSGPTVWQHNPPPPKPKAPLNPIYDRLGREVKLGDFVSYAMTWYNTSKINVYFGTVTKISDRNVVYCTNIKLDDDDTVTEERIKDNSSMVLITKDLIDQLMIKRLSAF
jgi:hypothetical protein